MTGTNGSRIKQPKYAKQLIDFDGLQIEENIYPTDIDAIIEYHNGEYIIVEVKYKKTRMPFSQRVAIQRMVDDFTKLGKKAIAIIGEHHITDSRKPIVAADCNVREVYYGDEGIWRAPVRKMVVGQAVEEFHKANIRG